MSERLIVAIAEAIRDSVLRVGDVDGRPLSAERAMWASPTRLAEAAAAVVAAEVAAREAAAAEAMREACADAVFRLYDESMTDGEEEYAQGASESFDAIRALPLPAPDALTRALARARVEERDACAEVAAGMRFAQDPGDIELACPQTAQHIAAAIRAGEGGGR